MKNRYFTKCVVFFLTIFTLLSLNTALLYASENKPEATKVTQILIEHEESLTNINHQLFEVLKIRLDRYNVKLVSKQIDSTHDNTHANEVETKNYDWIITLKNVGEKNIMMGIDSTSPQLAVSEIRTIEKVENLEHLSWTMGLVVEKTVAPFLDNSDLVALGVGLALIEPDVISGTTVEQKKNKTKYPALYGVGLGLGLAGIWSVKEVMVGPELSIKGIFSKETLVQFRAGWSSKAKFSTNGVEGSLSQIPFELLFGYLFANTKNFDLIGWGGLSMGFSLYNTSEQAGNRTDLTFVPGAIILLEAVAKFKKPWAFYVNGGGNFPFIRDSLVNNGNEIYTHVWIVPVFTMGLELNFH